jgi:hypothetical protein
LVITRTVSLIINPSSVQGEEIVRETNPLIVPYPSRTSTSPNSLVLIMRGELGQLYLGGFCFCHA